MPWPNAENGEQTAVGDSNGINIIKGY